MLQKKILVPLDASTKNLMSVHYALSLAERLKAQVYILQETVQGNAVPYSVWLEETLVDLIGIARQAGLEVEHYIGDGELKEEIIGLINANEIDLVVFGENDESYKQLFNQFKTKITPKIIRVKEKETINYP